MKKVKNHFLFIFIFWSIQTLTINSSAGEHLYREELEEGIKSIQQTNILDNSPPQVLLETTRHYNNLLKVCNKILSGTFSKLEPLVPACNHVNCIKEKLQSVEEAGSILYNKLKEIKSGLQTFSPSLIKNLRSSTVDLFFNLSQIWVSLERDFSLEIRTSLEELYKHDLECCKTAGAIQEEVLENLPAGEDPHCDELEKYIKTQIKIYQRALLLTNSPTGKKQPKHKRYKEDHERVRRYFESSIKKYEEASSSSASSSLTREALDLYKVYYPILETYKRFIEGVIKTQECAKGPRLPIRDARSLGMKATAVMNKKRTEGVSRLLQTSLSDALRASYAEAADALVAVQNRSLAPGDILRMQTEVDDKIIAWFIDPSQDAIQEKMVRLVEDIKQAEENLAAYTQTLPGSSQEISLKDKYKTYVELFIRGGSDNSKIVSAIDRLRSRITAFIRGGQLEEALARAEALADLEKEKTGEESFKTKYFIAFLKNLMGDSQDLLAIIRAGEERKARKKAATKTAKEKKRLQNIHALQQKRVEEQAERESREAVRQQTLQAAARVASSHPTFSVKKEMLEPATDHLISVSDTQAKVEKLQRHLKAEALRAAAEPSRDDEALRVSPSSSAASSSAEMSSPSRVESTLAPLRPAIRLAPATRRVDEEITGNTWRITRPQLERYFADMGCQIATGKGSHKKIVFSDTLVIEKDGELIMILNDSGGGALTLPQWNDDVPYYLRKQILSAREKLSNLIDKGGISMEEINGEG